MPKEPKDIEARVKAYIKARGVHCPLCESTDIEGGPIEIDEGRAYQEMSCNKCDTQWSDIYELKAVEISHIPDEEDNGETNQNGG